MAAHQGFTVTCSQCGTELLAGKRFCHACGAEAISRCPSCGEAVQPHFRFCPDCGARLSAAADAAVELPAANETAAPGDAPSEPRLSVQVPDPLAEKLREGWRAGERKRVTVLFCDLVGSTAIAEAMDPEEYRDLLDRYLELAFREVYRFEGVVNQVAGDGIMALFGAPLAHEDAPQRAVRAALAIRDALRGFNEEHHAQSGHELRLRIGIHTGPVVLGPVGNDLKMAYTAIGDTTNLASRLQSLAEPGMVLISEATHRIVRGFFHVRSIGPVTVKGKSQPVGAYEVLGFKEAATPMAIAAARGLTPLVGRREELAQLEACYARLSGQLAQVVAIIGHAGSGKSRLLYEFKQQLPSDAVLLEARCSSLTQVVPYGPFASMFKQFFGVEPCDPPEVVRAKVMRHGVVEDEHGKGMCPAVGRLFSLPTPGPLELSPDEIKRETFEAIAHFVIGMSEQAPVIMMIEDLQWIDDLSSELLQLAVERLYRKRVMLIVTHRPEYEPHWHAHGAFTQLHLPRLSDEETAEVVRAVAGGQLPAELEQRVIATAEGNPFFAEEITRALIEEGYLLRSDRLIRLTRPVDQIRIPDTIHELLGARLDRLRPQAKRVLQVAAVLGRQFDRSRLLRILEPEGIDVDAELGALEHDGLIHRKMALSGDEFRFGESLTQEIAYEALLLRDRRQLHERVGLLLEGEPGESSAERSALLAHHFTRSDNREKAIAALLHAGLDAEKLPSYPAAVRLYRQAWELAEAALAEAPASPQLRRWAVDAALSFCRVVAIYTTADDEELEHVVEHGARLAQELKNEQAVAGFYAYQGMFRMSGTREGFAEGLALAEKGRATAHAAGLEEVEINISRALAWGYFIDGRCELARNTIDWVVDQLEQTSHRARLSDLYLGSRSMREAVYLYTDGLEEAARGAEETHRLAVEASNRTVQSLTASTRATVAWMRGDYAAAQRAADASLEIAETIGNVSAIRTSAIVALGARIELGLPSNSARYVPLIEQQLSAAGDLSLKAAMLVDVYLALGEPKRAAQIAASAYQHAGGRLREALASVALADAMRALGPERWGKAVVWYDRAIDLATEIGAQSVLAAARLGAGELALLQGDEETATGEIGEALAICSRLGFGRYQARAERLLAQLDAAAAQG